jgi:serine/threonine-protein kinase HipA
MSTARISIWGSDVGVVAWDSNRNVATLEFLEEFVRREIDLAPLTMPLERLQNSDRIFSFPTLNPDTFRKLPGLLADSLPDRFGNDLIDLWLAGKGRSIDDFTPVDRLCYVGKRGMGALEFEPAYTDVNHPEEIHLSELVEIAQEVIKRQGTLDVQFGKDDQKALAQIIQVGTTAGGMRPKAIIAVDPSSQKIVAGDLEAPPGYDYWLLKFDGVQDDVFGSAQGYGIIEYVYYLIAKQCGIIMSECRLLPEKGRAHFMTRRFDRKDGVKIHMQTLTGIAHYDFNNIGSTSYEQLFQVMRRLRLGHDEMEQMFRRLALNIVARNQDDHPKNTSFLLEQGGYWTLSPAYDLSFAYNPAPTANTSKHQMSINGRRADITREDLHALAHTLSIKKPDEIIDAVVEAVSHWPSLAQQHDLPKEKIERIASYLRLDI